MNIEIKNLSLTYPNGKQALKEMNLSIKGNCLIGLLGANGAGKSTLMKLLTQSLLPSKGSILVDGKPLTQEINQYLGYLPQSFALYENLTIYQFLDYMAALKKVKDSSAIDQVINQVHLSDKANAKIKTLSGGQRQRIGIAQALLGNPKLLIFDEPTVGLDPEERIYFRKLFLEIAKQRILILSTHIIEDLQAITQRLIVLNRGSICFDDTPEALLKAAENQVVEINDLSLLKAEDRIVSVHNTLKGINYRAIISNPISSLPKAEPTLEDAYMALLMRGEAK